MLTHNFFGAKSSKLARHERVRTSDNFFLAFLAKLINDESFGHFGHGYFY